MSKINKVKKVYNYAKHNGLWGAILYIVHWAVSRSRYEIYLNKCICCVERQHYLAEIKKTVNKETGKTITFPRFRELLERYPFLIGRYYEERWPYIKEVVDIINEESPKRILELGPHLIPIVEGSDVMDITQNLQQLTYHQDATKFPWTIENSKYDLFIALQVWEHLQDKQQQAFKEVMRISQMAILSFPYKWNCVGDVHHGIDEEVIAEWTLHVQPEKVIKVGRRIIYFFKFNK